MHPLNWIDLYPVNPHSLASFRLTFFSSRAKDDPIDSQLLEELVRTHSDDFVPISQNQRQNANSINTAGIAVVCWI
jgi:Transposase.